MAKSASALQGLSRQEQFDFHLSRRFPKFSGRTNRFVYRLTGGHVGGTKRGIPIGLLTTTGRRSGKARTVPIMYLDDDSRFLVVASNGGFDRPPAWCLNLQADPQAEFRTKAGAVKVTACELTEAEQRELWDRIVQHNPLWGAFQSCTKRRTLVIALQRPQSREST
jgi:F420H(2)-dependent quinone reductase